MSTLPVARKANYYTNWADSFFFKNCCMLYE